MKFKDFVNERQETRHEDRGTTTKVNGHTHDWFLNRFTGDGSTSKDKGHIHKIKAMVVLPAENWKDDHIHGLK